MLSPSPIIWLLSKVKITADYNVALRKSQQQTQPILLPSTIAPEDTKFHVITCIFGNWLLNYDFRDSIFRSRSTWPRSQRGQRSPLNPNFWRAQENYAFLNWLIGSTAFFCSHLIWGSFVHLAPSKTCWPRVDHSSEWYNA